MTSQNHNDHDQDHEHLTDGELEFGQLATSSEAFCAWPLVKKYPYLFIGAGNLGHSDEVKRKPKFECHRVSNFNFQVAKAFWDEGKLLDQTWDL